MCSSQNRGFNLWGQSRVSPECSRKKKGGRGRGREGDRDKKKEKKNLKYVYCGCQVFRTQCSALLVLSSWSSVDVESRVHNADAFEEIISWVVRTVEPLVHIFSLSLRKLF